MNNKATSQEEDALEEEFKKSQLADSEVDRKQEEALSELLDEESEELSEESLETELEGESLEMVKLQQEFKAEQNKYLRLLAEFENTRKRMMKEKQDSNQFAQERVLTELLAPLDQFENALKFAKDSTEEVQNWAKGFEMILSQFKELLRSYSVEEFHSEGKAFDPHFHEALETEETDSVEENRITKEFVKGYQCKGRVLRPAKVKVSKKIESPKEESHESK